MNREWVKRAERGFVAGAVGVGSMTAVRALARRANWIDETVPEVVVEWLRQVTPLRDPAGGSSERAFLEAFQFVYGGVWGAGAFSVLARSRRVVAPAVALGLITLAAGQLPIRAFRIARPAWQSSARENTVNVVAHLLYGFVTVLLAQEMTRRPLHGATGWRHRARVRVG